MNNANLQQMIQQLSVAQQQEKQRIIPDLTQWNPQLCGEMDLCIKANGEWWHEGSPIQRQALIDLFAKVLCYEQGQYYLKTPIEKIQIQVEDAPLHIKDVQQRGDEIYFISTQGDEILLDEQHPIELRQVDGQWKPYIYVRYGLWALIQRHVFYHLIDLGQLQQNAQNDTILTLKSGHFSVELITPSL